MILTAHCKLILNHCWLRGFFSLPVNLNWLLKQVREPPSRSRHATKKDRRINIEFRPLKKKSVCSPPKRSSLCTARK